MNDKAIFAAALELKHPWHVTSVRFEGTGKSKQLHIDLAHEKGVKFLYEDEYYPVYDHQERTWRHLNFFQHECYIYANVPRVKTSENKVRLIDVPWADSESSFTLLFEEYVCELAKNGMGASGCGAILKMDSRRIFRILKRKVINAITTQDLDEVKELSIDETSSKKGHNYLTILADRARKKIVGIGFGKDKNAVKEAITELEIRNASISNVKTVTLDMSRPFIAACNEFLPQGEIVFDRFHLALNLNKAIDAIRKEEQSSFSELKKTKFLWLKNPKKLKSEQKILLEELSKQYSKIGTAYRLKELFREVFDNAKNDNKLKWLNQWMKEANETGIIQLQKFVIMLKTHWYGIKTYFKKIATNAYAERVNLKIQDIKRLAKGYRNMTNFKVMIYFHLGGLKF